MGSRKYDKKKIVKVSQLEQFFPDENELENNVWYDMFEYLSKKKNEL